MRLCRTDRPLWRRVTAECVQPDSGLLCAEEKLLFFVLRRLQIPQGEGLEGRGVFLGEGNKSLQFILRGGGSSPTRRQCHVVLGSILRAAGEPLRPPRAIHLLGMGRSFSEPMLDEAGWDRLSPNLMLVQAGSGPS